MPHLPEGEPNREPETTHFFKGSRRVRIAKSAGAIGLGLLAAGGYTYLATRPTTIYSEIVSDNNQPVQARDTSGNEIDLEPGTKIDVLCYGPQGYRFSIDAGFWQIDPTAEGVPRVNIHALEDPFHAAQAPGGPQDPLVPLGDC